MKNELLPAYYGQTPACLLPLLKQFPNFIALPAVDYSGLQMRCSRSFFLCIRHQRCCDITFFRVPKQLTSDVLITIKTIDTDHVVMTYNVSYLNLLQLCCEVDVIIMKKDHT